MLFNKNNTGAKEAKLLLGFIYLSNNFENLITYINIAERELRRVVGKEIYNLAHDHYHSDDYNVPEQTVKGFLLLDEMVKFAQLSAMLHAYRRYAPGMDLAHSDSGRSITVTDDKKPAFEWMIDKDNKNLLDLAHEATEALLEFLDEQLPLPVPEGETPVVNSIGDAWRSSSSFSLAKSVMISSSTEFDSIYPIKNSRRLYLALIPFIRETENRHIVPIIGKLRYAAIIEKIKDLDLSEEEKEIVSLAKVPIALITMSIALKRLSVEQLPDSVVQGISDSNVLVKKVAGSSDRIGVSALLERDGRRMLLDLQSYVFSLLDPAPIVIVPETDINQAFFIS